MGKSAQNPYAIGLGRFPTSGKELGKPANIVS
jgi:hypothetical protein